MKYEIIDGDGFPLLKFSLDSGEAIKARAGAMVAMTDALDLTGKVDGGLGRALGRMFSGESFFLQNIEAVRGTGRALLASPPPGAIYPIDVVSGEEWTVQKNGFLAGTAEITVSTKVQGLMKGVLSGQGLFVVKVGGQGTAFLSLYGSVHVADLAEGETLLIDNGHLVAWKSAMRYEITKGAASWFSAVTSGEGFACRFYGPGRVLIQTRNPYAFGRWLLPFLPRLPKQS